MTTVCETCQREFNAPPSRRARFCCRDCWRDSQRDAMVPCENCGRIFRAGIDNGRVRRFCCRDCWRGGMPRGADSPSWKDGSDNYWTYHNRVNRARGPAKNYPCADCGGQAQDWSLIHGRDGADLAHFEPRCRYCHSAYDGSGARLGESNHNAKLAWEQVREIRAQRGISTAVLAGRYDVDPSTILRVLAGQTWRDDAYIPPDTQGRAKLTWAQVCEIRAQHGTASHRALAKRYGVDSSTITAILTGRTWKEPPTPG